MFSKNLNPMFSQAGLTLFVENMTKCQRTQSKLCKIFCSYPILAASRPEDAATSRQPWYHPDALACQHRCNTDSLLYALICMCGVLCLSSDACCSSWSSKLHHNNIACLLFETACHSIVLFGGASLPQSLSEQTIFLSPLCGYCSQMQMCYYQNSNTRCRWSCTELVHMFDILTQRPRNRCSTEHHQLLCCTYHHQLTARSAVIVSLTQSMSICCQCMAVTGPS